MQYYSILNIQGIYSKRQKDFLKNKIKLIKRWITLHFKN